MAFPSRERRKEKFINEPLVVSLSSMEKVDRRIGVQQQPTARVTPFSTRYTANPSAITLTSLLNILPSILSWMVVNALA